MKYRFSLILGFLVLCLAACQRQNTVCPEPEGYPLSQPALAELIALPRNESSSERTTVQIAGKMVTVDKVVSGPLCNDTWSGKVYVGCDVIVAAWNETEPPLFFKGCDLQIEPGTVVYVAGHNDAPYYRGCSCHTGEEPTN
jgi:hypothetical protein